MRRAALAFALTAVTSVSAQQTTPVFKAGVTLVTIDVGVVDKDGRPVPGLTAGDFEVKLNGKTQPVRALSYVEVAHGADRTAADPFAGVTGRHIIANTAPAGGQKVFVLAVDDLSFPSESGKRTLKSARRFVEAQPGDVFVGLTTTTGTTVVNPTLDRAAVLDALDHIVGAFQDPRRPLTPNGPTVGIAEAVEIVDHSDASLLDTVLTRECLEAGRTNGTGPGLYAAAISAFNSKCANDAMASARLIASETRETAVHQISSLTRALAAMRGVSGLKQMVLLSEGIGVTRDSHAALNPVGRAAAEAGVQLSVIMEDGDDADRADSGHAANELGATMPDTGLSNRRRADKLMFRSSLQTLAELTGGTFALITGDADSAFERAALAGSALYRIGVEVPGDAAPSKPLTVEVAVNRPGVMTRVNRQAVVPAVTPRAAVPEQVTAAIRTAQPFYGVPIRLAVATRRAASKREVELGIGLEVPASAKGPLTMTFGIVNAAGELKQASRKIPVPPAGENHRLAFPVSVAPGAHSLRVAVVDASGGIGSVATSLDVKLTPMGTIDASDVLTWWKDASGDTQFLALDSLPAEAANLGAGIELYPQPGTSLPKDVTVRMSLIAVGSTVPVVDGNVPTRPSGDMLRAEATLPLASLPAGLYVLKATVSAGGVVIGEASAGIRKGRSGGGPDL